MASSRNLEKDFDEFVKANGIEYNPKWDRPLFYSRLNSMVFEKPEDGPEANYETTLDVWCPFESNGEGYRHICDVRWCVTMPLQFILRNIGSKNVKIHYTNSKDEDADYESITQRRTNKQHEITVTKDYLKNQVDNYRYFGNICKYYKFGKNTYQILCLDNYHRSLYNVQEHINGRERKNSCEKCRKEFEFVKQFDTFEEKYRYDLRLWLPETFPCGMSRDKLFPVMKPYFISYTFYEAPDD